MNEHGHVDGHGQAAVAEAHGEHHAPAAPELRFEKEELREFEAEDRHAGRNIGVLLGCVFCVLLVLMLFVTYWTTQHKAVGKDPQAIPTAEESGDHH
jgi:ABC-type uncharacterized transport system permease subunit|uniref:Uncharacterized protein n=1 Tax=Schlesneria paludicola TaxID=360056 RepID=A0A7C4QT81_9PLAN